MRSFNSFSSVNPNKTEKVFQFAYSLNIATTWIYKYIYIYGIAIVCWAILILIRHRSGYSQFSMVNALDSTKLSFKLTPCLSQDNLVGSKKSPISIISTFAYMERETYMILIYNEILLPIILFFKTQTEKDKSIVKNCIIFTRTIGFQ